MTTSGPTAEVEICVELPVPAQPGTVRQDSAAAVAQGAAPDAGLQDTDGTGAVAEDGAGEAEAEARHAAWVEQLEDPLTEVLKNPGDMIEELIAAAAENADRRREYHEQPLNVADDAGMGGAGRRACARSGRAGARNRGTRARRDAAMRAVMTGCSFL